MKLKNMYSKLTFYLDTCYSGSIFESLPNDINIYAVSSSHIIESSWAAYCPPNGKFDQYIY